MFYRLKQFKHSSFQLQLNNREKCEMQALKNVSWQELKSKFFVQRLKKNILKCLMSINKNKQK